MAAPRRWLLQLQRGPRLRAGRVLESDPQTHNGSASSQACIRGEEGGGDALEGGEVPPPPPGAQPMPSHCPPDAKRQLQWHL